MKKLQDLKKAKTGLWKIYIENEDWQGVEDQSRKTESEWEGMGWMWSKHLEPSEEERAQGLGQCW